MIPAWILDIFAAIMLVVAAVSAGRLMAARPWARHPADTDTDTDIDAAHVLMGVAMAGMLAGGLRTLPSAAWTAVFAVITVWFGWRVTAEVRAQGAGALGTGHRLPHLLHGAAMVYMFAAVAAPAHSSRTGMSGMAVGGSMGTLRLPTLGLVFVLLMAAWAVWDLDQVGRPHGHARRFALPPGPGIQPEPAVAFATAGPGATAPAASTETASMGPAPDPAAPAAAIRGTGGGETAASWLLDPRVTVASRIAMGITMALMLVITL
jgi:Domain of unknown function (DUF5134)